MNESVGVHKERKECVRNIERKILRESGRIMAKFFEKFCANILTEYVLFDIRRYQCRVFVKKI